MPKPPTIPDPATDTLVDVVQQARDIGLLAEQLDDRVQALMVTLQQLPGVLAVEPDVPPAAVVDPAQTAIDL